MCDVFLFVRWCIHLLSPKTSSLLIYGQFLRIFLSSPPIDQVVCSLSFFHSAHDPRRRGVVDACRFYPQQNNCQSGLGKILDFNPVLGDG